jgi:hypothetical protein
LIRGAVEIQQRKQMNIKGTIIDRLKPASGGSGARMFEKFRVK